MTEIALGKHNVVVYGSIDELPMVRFHKYNKYLLIDAGIGTDLTAIDGHIERAVRYIKDDKRTEAGKEMENLRQSIYMALQGMSPKHLSFACMVQSIDGKEYNDLSDDGLQKVVDILGDVPIKDITASVEAVKKKIDDELTLYFPSIFDDSRSKEFYDILKARTMAILDTIINGESESQQKRIERLTNDMVTYAKPMCFSGTGSAEIEYDRQFENMCLVISKNLHTNPKNYTVLEYYNAYLFIEKQEKEQKLQNKAR